MLSMCTLSLALICPIAKFVAVVRSEEPLPHELISPLRPACSDHATPFP